MMMMAFKFLLQIYNNVDDDDDDDDYIVCVE